MSVAALPKELAICHGNARSRRRLACVHEAGHAVARWYFGHEIFFAKVGFPSVGFDWHVSNLETVRVEGVVLGPDISLPVVRRDRKATFDRDFYKRAGEMRAEMDLIVKMSGMAAQARDQRQSFLSCLLGGGESDWRSAKGLALTWFPTRKSEALELAVRRARAVISSKPAARSLEEIATLLKTRGRVTGSAINDVCEAKFGGFCGWRDWLGCWPPDTGQLRAGLMPCGLA